MALAFEQQPKESHKAFAAFSLYLSMGPERSTEAVAKKLAKSEQLVRRWSSRWDWTDRVQAYATHMALVERESTEALLRAKSVDWLQRQEEHRAEEWQVRGELPGCRETLVKDRRVRGIEVLCRLSRIKRPPAEGDDPAPQVADREHDPMAEAVIGYGDVVAGDQHAGGDQVGEADALAVDLRGRSARRGSCRGAPGTSPRRSASPARCSPRGRLSGPCSFPHFLLCN